MIDDAKRDLVLDHVEEAWSTHDVEILDVVDLSRVGWEFGYLAALVRRPGAAGRADPVPSGGNGRRVGTILRERVEAHRRLLVEPEALLARWGLEP